MPKVHQHVPNLPEKTDDIPVTTPLAPLLGVAVQRSSGLPDHYGVQNFRRTGDALRKSWHRGSAKVIRYVANREPESTMPLQFKPILIREFVQHSPGGRTRESRVRHQEFDIPVQYDGTVYSGLHARV